jgi:hypothetical protein
LKEALSVTETTRPSEAAMTTVALEPRLPNRVPDSTELIPSQLHLDRRQIATLRGPLTDTIGCGVKRQVVIAGGANGGIWVESLR